MSGRTSRIDAHRCASSGVVPTIIPLVQMSFVKTKCCKDKRPYRRVISCGISVMVQLCSELFLEKSSCRGLLGVVGPACWLDNVRSPGWRCRCRDIVLLPSTSQVPPCNLLHHWKRLTSRDGTLQWALDRGYGCRRRLYWRGTLRKISVLKTCRSTTLLCIWSLWSTTHQCYIFGNLCQDLQTASCIAKDSKFMVKFGALKGGALTRPYGQFLLCS